MNDVVAIRPARQSDGRFLLDLRNSDAVVDASRVRSTVTAEEHARWLDRSLDAPDRRLFVITLDGRAAGQARLDDIDGEEWVSIALVDGVRGRRIGTRALELLQHVARLDLRAEIRIGNLASLRAFHATGFDTIGSDDEFVVVGWSRQREGGDRVAHGVEAS